MPTWATIVIGILGTDAVIEIVKALAERIREKRGKKPQMQKDIETLSAKVDKIAEHTAANYLSILRITVMDDAMPMSERILAGQAYIEAGGNGEVKHYYNQLKERVDNETVS